MNKKAKPTKIVILIGSPRKKGNTSIMVSLLENELKESSISKHYLYDYQILPCTDCRGCKKGDKTCIVRDDLPLINQEMESADVIVFGTPIYWYGPTAKMKLLIDRLRPYYVNRKLEGKKGALLLPAADGECDCDITIEMFQRIFKTLGIEYLGRVSTQAFDAGDCLNDQRLSPSIKNLCNNIIL